MSHIKSNLIPASDNSKFRAWIVLAAATGVNLSMGMNYSWSLVKKAIVAEWHWTNVEASLPYTVYAVVIAVSMLFGGRLQDKFGPRLIGSLASIFMATGLILCSLVQNPALLTMAYGIAAIGAGIASSTTIPTAIKWFPPGKRGVVTGIVVGGSGLAPAYISPIARWILETYGISSTFYALGVGISASILIMAQFMNNPPDGYEYPVPLKQITFTSAIGRDAIEYPRCEMLRTMLFYKLWFMFFFSATAGLMVFGHIASIASVQANWENGFYLVMILAVSSTLGRLTGGYLSDRYGRLMIMKAVFIFQAINLIMFSSYATSLLLGMGAAFLGLCYGGCLALFPMAVADYYGMKNFGGNYGILFTAWGSAAIAGPILAGWAVDLTGSYFIAYIVSAGLLALALILAYTINLQGRCQVVCASTAQAE